MRQRLRGRLRSRVAWLGGLAARRVALALVGFVWLVAIVLTALTVRPAGTVTLTLTVAGLVSLGALQLHRHHRIVMHQLQLRATVPTTPITSRRDLPAPADQPGTDLAAEAIDRLKLTALALGRLSEELVRVSEEVLEGLETGAKQLGADLEAAVSLRLLLTPSALVPPTHPWDVSATLIARVVELITTRRPSLVVACDGGVTAVWCALAVQRFRMPSRIVALEQNQGKVGALRAQLAAHDATDLAEVRYAPVEQVGSGPEPVRWYSLDAWSDLEQIGLLMVNGPPPGLGSVPSSGLALVSDRVAAPGAVVVADHILEVDGSAIERLLADRGLASAHSIGLGGRTFVRPAVPAQRRRGRGGPPTEAATRLQDPPR